MKIRNFFIRLQTKTLLKTESGKVIIPKNDEWRKEFEWDKIFEEMEGK